MGTYYLSFLLFVIHWDILDNCKVWTKSLMVMFGASCRSITLRIHLDWALERQNALDICVVEMIIVLYFKFFLCAMNFLGVGIVHSFEYLGNVLSNIQSIPLVISFAILPPHVYKFVVANVLCCSQVSKIFKSHNPLGHPCPFNCRQQM
jgi:hypothetical protein